MTIALVVLAVVTVGCWLLSLVTSEHSWVDRIWSVVPPVYAWCFAAEADFAARPTLMAVLATLWGARLTFNFWRKGGYARGGEDYRWAILRNKMPAWAWQPFNLGFIHVYQNLLIFAFTLPAWVVTRSAAPIGWADAALAVAFLLFLAGETIADQQQWNFHAQKAAGTAPGPFLADGLFAWSRHPNFFCEQAQWWVFAGFVFAAGLPASWDALLGATLLTLLFDGSTRFTESITLSKYPSYADYQRRTSRLVPWFPARA